jgi:hypothetical protein
LNCQTKHCRTSQQSPLGKICPMKDGNFFFYNFTFKLSDVSCNKLLFGFLLFSFQQYWLLNKMYYVPIILNIPSFQLIFFSFKNKKQHKQAKSRLRVRRLNFMRSKLNFSWGQIHEIKFVFIFHEVEIPNNWFDLLIMAFFMRSKLPNNAF